MASTNLEPDSEDENHRDQAAGPPDDTATAEAGADPVDQEARGIPLWDSGQISQRVSQAVAEALGLNGYILSHVPGRWRELRGVVVTLHEMRPHEQLHPGTVPCGDETLRSLEERATLEQEAHRQAADHEGFVDGPLFGIHADPDRTQRVPPVPRVGHRSSPPVPEPARVTTSTTAGSSRTSSKANNKSRAQLSRAASPPAHTVHPSVHRTPKHPWCPGEAEKSDLPCEGRGQDSFDRPLFRTEAGETSPTKEHIPIAPPAEAGIPLNSTLSCMRS